VSFELFNRLTAYGDQVRLNIEQDPNIIIANLKQFDDNWGKYNPRKNVDRWALSVTNLNGKLEPGPDLDSIPEYNKENNTNITESSFAVPTPVYDIVSYYCDPFKKWLGRTHILKFGAGGFFPDHIDNKNDTIGSFRLFVPLQVCNPTDFGYFIYEDKILNWKYGSMYFINTCKRHTVFNANLEDDHIVIIMNIKLTEESVKTVINFLIS
tara:strand:- start:908 stop:1537 length:630 start_codon:yes stop_codon:yes gene_type:complete